MKPSTSSTVSYGTNVQFACIFPVIRRDTFRWRLASIEQDDLFAGCAQQVTGFESQTKGRARNLRNEKVALLQPSHVAPVNILGADRTVRFPGIVADQVARQNLVPHFLQPIHNFPRRIDARTVTRNCKSEIYLHALRTRSSIHAPASHPMAAQTRAAPQCATKTCVTL